MEWNGMNKVNTHCIHYTKQHITTLNTVHSTFRFFNVGLSLSLSRHALFIDMLLVTCVALIQICNISLGAPKFVVGNELTCFLFPFGLENDLLNM